jgi:CubicO group peptidase (beta-lactamase class C family)
MITRRNWMLAAFAALRRERIDEAVKKIEAAAASGQVAAAALLVRQGSSDFRRGFGKARNEDEVFLLASITKPMTVAGLMRLVERKHVSLDHTVRRYIPEFRGEGREMVTVRQILTHTSGLPDMLPENTDLRKRHAPLKDFVAAVCRTPLLFRPGTQVRYQSMGILLAAEIAERITRLPFREYLRRDLFLPLQMRDSSLGLGGRKISETALCQVTGDEDWNWNSPYWRDFGAPWGGAHAPAGDVARFLEFFLRPRHGPLRMETATTMITNQNRRLNKPWGFGFMIEEGAFSKHCSPGTFGHYGSTGTVAWADRRKDLICVLLTTKPADQSRAGLLGPVSDMVAQAV